MTTDDDLDAEEYVTQYVFGDSPPPDRPRPQDRDGLSVLQGVLTVAEAARYVRAIAEPLPGDTVRYAQVKVLRAMGFVVTLTPSRKIPIHVSISTEAQWSRNTCDQYNTCFDENPTEGGEIP